jgi:hypothetical protein
MERHRFDALSFSFGVVYVLLGLIFLLPITPFDLIDTITLSIRWVWPAAILVIGAAILIPLVRPRSDR